MVKLIQSSKIDTPIIYLIENETDLLSIPMGIPFLRERKENYNEIVQLLEFEILFKSALNSKLPFKWRDILKKNGFGVTKTIENTEVLKLTDEGEEMLGSSIEEYIENTSYIVDIEYLKNLKIIPTWFTDIETAVKENIMNSILYNPTLYNKKLDMCSGDVELTTPEKNLIIIDISSSIPRAISKAVLLLAKTMASTFYADLLITGSKSTLYDYTEMDALNVKTIYDENETDNDQVHFLKLISEYRKYNTVISFGDNDYSGEAWRNTFNTRTRYISVEEGKTLNKWHVNHIIDFHTRDTTTLTGYVRWFTCESIDRKKNWVHYLD